MPSWQLSGPRVRSSLAFHLNEPSQSKFLLSTLSATRPPPLERQDLPLSGPCCDRTPAARISCCWYPRRGNLGLASLSARRIVNGKHCCTLLAALHHAVQGNWPRGLQAWGEAAVRRRDLLKAAAAATFSITAEPRLGRADRAKTLVFVPTSDLTILDPVVTGARPTRNSAYLVFDTLYGIDTEWKAQPQMVEGHTVEEDGLT